jgi:transposase
LPVLAGPRAARRCEPPDHALGPSRGGFGTKVHLLCDDRGPPLAIAVTAGQRHESTAFETAMARVRPPRRRGGRSWPERLGGDKGSSYPQLRRWLKRRRITGVIPTRKDQARDESFDEASHRKRNVIERMIGWFKGCRRLGTRFEELAVNYVAFWMVAMIEKLLH